MSYRDWEGDDYDYSALDAGRFEYNSKRVIVSPRGQRWLRDLEAALLAMPDKRLCTSLAEVHLEEDGFGERIETPLVCAVGALALYKGTPFDQLEPEGSSHDTLDAAENIGMARTLACLVGDQNDRYMYHQVSRLRYGSRWEMVDGVRTRRTTVQTDFRESFSDHETPAERWHRMLTWVRSQIIAPATA